MAEEPLETEIAAGALKSTLDDDWKIAWDDRAIVLHDSSRERLVVLFELFGLMEAMGYEPRSALRSDSGGVKFLFAPKRRCTDG